MKEHDRRLAVLVRLTTEIANDKRRRDKIDVEIKEKEKRRDTLQADIATEMAGAKATPKPKPPREKRPPASQGTYAHLAFQAAITDAAETVRRMAVPVDKAMLAKELGIPEQAAYIRLFRAAKANLLKQSGKGFYVPVEIDKTEKSDAP
jgi:hypothetical protein